MAGVIQVKARWDPDAQAWVAGSDDVPGLVTEADTMEALTVKLRALIPELLEANGTAPATDAGELHFEILAERHERIHLGDWWRAT